ncbi:MAG: ImmA/IrrE family metallo-endopeptidase, partial [Candidatus Geothermincolia bacterium]
AALICNRWFVWINGTHSPRRRRWVLSHELGHIAMEHTGVAFLDSGERTWQQLSANRFAAELLMPEDLVVREHARALEVGMSVGDLADIFLVDKRVAELRLDELSLKL